MTHAIGGQGSPDTPSANLLAEEAEIAPEAQVLFLIRRLCTALADEGVRYCHWKSTQALDRSASGENDLDLLVAEDDFVRFERILEALGFKEVLVARPSAVPGVHHFFGPDWDSTRWVDVHAHRRLFLGDDATKNYRLPIEEAYLASSSTRELFKIPAPEFEFVVLTVRLMLKHGTPEALLTGRGTLSVGELAELRHLLGRLDRERLRAAIDEHVSFLDEAVVEVCVQSLEPGCPLATRRAAWRALHPSLVPLARRSRHHDIWLQVWRRVDRRIRRRVLGREVARRLVGGGYVVALVGSDGSGKSTAVEGLARWLSRVSDTKTMHLGKPRRSTAWLAVRAAAKLARAVGIGSDTEHLWLQGRTGVSTPGYLWMITGALNARDRYRASIRARLAASRGAIVISDRYPLPHILRMDGPRDSEETVSQLAGWRRRLASIERRYYGRVPKPDVVIALRVDPEIAVCRRPGDDPATIKYRARQIAEADWPQGALVIDANRPVADVLEEIQRRLWSRLHV